MCQRFETHSWGPGWKTEGFENWELTGQRVGSTGEPSGQNRPGRQELPYPSTVELLRLREGMRNPPVAGQPAVARFKEQPKVPTPLPAAGTPFTVYTVRTSWLTSASTGTLKMAIDSTTSHTSGHLGLVGTSVTINSHSSCLGCVDLTGQADLGMHTQPELRCEFP